MFSNFALLDFSTPELVIILAIVLILFGGKKLPDLSRSLGESIREVRKAASGTSELRQELKGQVDTVKADLSGRPSKDI